ncbi:MAG: CbbQ/NirQ/NorQ/GpvN family protein [Aeromicrobium sp.]
MTTQPFYLATNGEDDVFIAAARAGLPVMLKGPTGCGKTRFVESMAAKLGRELITVACHEDLMASDLTGRHLLIGDETVWVDGPLTRAVRTGAICYLDEVVEARQDTVVVLHSLLDHRRELTLERNDEFLNAADGFQLVVSYNPGYQSVIKDLKDSTRQRMVAIDMSYPTKEIEGRIIEQEAGVHREVAECLVRLGTAIRDSGEQHLREVASTRTLVTAARLHQAGLHLRGAAIAAIALPLTDDPRLVAGLTTIVETYVS